LSKEPRSSDTTVICLGQCTNRHFLSSLTVSQVILAELSLKLALIPPRRLLRLSSLLLPLSRKYKPRLKLNWIALSAMIACQPMKTTRRCRIFVQWLMKFTVSVPMHPSYRMPRQRTLWFVYLAPLFTLLTFSGFSTEGISFQKAPPSS
jgi:hypothetical protein